MLLEMSLLEEETRSTLPAASLSAGPAHSSGETKGLHRSDPEKSRERNDVLLLPQARPSAKSGSESAAKQRPGHAIFRNIFSRLNRCSGNRLRSATFVPDPCKYRGAGPKAQAPDWEHYALTGDQHGQDDGRAVRGDGRPGIS